ncbi:MAG: class II fructose-bisphosphate aldolase [Bacteroidota bacterium]
MSWSIASSTFLYAGMPRVSPALLYRACYGKYAIAAVNVFCMEQILGLFEAAHRARAPFIVAITPYARDYASPVMFEHMIRAAAAQYPDAIFATHLDHGNDAHCVDAIASGWYTSVMIDASHDAFEQNVARTAKVVELAHQKDLVVEAELGVLSGVEDDLVVAAGDASYTNPDQCADFVTQTGCDSLAIAVGTSHGAYKFSGDQGLQFHILEAIQQRLPGFPLVLHGGSNVDVDEVDRINNAGGTLKAGAKGVAPDEIRRAIPYGICKVNVATDTRILWTRVHREYFRDQPENIDLVVPGKMYIEAYADLIEQKFALFGARDKAPELQQMLLASR